MGGRGAGPREATPALWLRGVLWLGSSAAVAAFAALLGAEVLDLDGEAVALAAGLVTATHAGVLWWRRPRPLQQLACLAGLAVAAGAGVALAGANEAAVGLSVWAVGVGWVLAGWRGLLPPTVVALLVAGGIVVLQGTGHRGALGGGRPGVRAGQRRWVAGSGDGRSPPGVGSGRDRGRGHVPARHGDLLLRRHRRGPGVAPAGRVVLLTVTLVLLRWRPLPRAQATLSTPTSKQPEEPSSPSDSTTGPRAA